MDLSSDISTEDLEVFLQEAQEQLELLDEEIVRLEREEDTAPLLQEIFRAAHTLKGSAGMIGQNSPNSARERPEGSYCLADSLSA